MTGLQVTSALLASLRPGDVVELRSPGSDRADRAAVLIRGRLVRPMLMSGEPDAQALMIGDDRNGLLLLNREGWAQYWAQVLELTVLERAPRLYENSSRTAPVVGDIVRDRDGHSWQLHADGWVMSSLASVRRAQEAVSKYGPLVLLWDGATNSLPGPAS